jgi:hypothetical protein
LDPTDTPDHVHDDWDNDANEDGQNFDFSLLPAKDSEIHPERIHSSSANLQWVYSINQDDHDVLIEEAPDNIASYQFSFVSPICPGPATDQPG